MLMIRPQPRDSMCGITARLIKKVPLRLTLMTESQASSGTSQRSRRSAPWGAAALLTSTSMRPNRASASATKRSTSAARLTSPTIVCARRPRASISPARLSRPFQPWRISSSPSSFSLRVPPDATSVATMSAPVRANATEIARPIPRTRPHPVISTTLPSSSLTGRTSFQDSPTSRTLGSDERRGRLWAVVPDGRSLMIHAVDEPLRENLGEGVQGLHRVGPDRGREHAAVHNVEVGDLLARPHVPQPLPGRHDGDVRARAHLVARLQMCGGQQSAVWRELQMPLEQVGLLDLREIDAAHRIEVGLVQEILVRGDDDRVRAAEEHHADAHGDAGPKPRPVALAQRVLDDRVAL